MMYTVLIMVNSVNMERERNKVRFDTYLDQSYTIIKKESDRLDF